MRRTSVRGMPRTPIGRARTGIATLAALLVTVGCDALLTDPAPPPSTIEVSFQIAPDAEMLGGPAAAFAKVRRAFVRFVRPDSTVRDTVFAVAPFEGRIRVPVALEVRERVSALGIVASLGFGTSPLFEGGTVVRIEAGEPTTAVIDVQPVPAIVVADRPVALISNVGESIQLSSAVLFASFDTITGLEGTWLSEDPTIISVTPEGIATARLLGQTSLEVRFADLADTIVAATSPVDTILTSPEAVTLARGETAQIATELQDALGNMLLGRTVSYGTVDQSVATVDGTGLVTAVGPGSTSVVVTSETAATSVSVTVSALQTLQWLEPMFEWPRHF